MKPIDTARREALKQGSATAIFGLFVAAGLVRPAPPTPHENRRLRGQGHGCRGQEFRRRGHGRHQGMFVGTTPEIAENGAVVPVSVTSNIPKTESISILIDKNPNTLAATFTIPPGTDANVSTRVKMGETSQVHALIKADGKYFVATREIKVTLGGCGG